MNHVFIVLINIFLYLVVAKFPALLKFPRISFFDTAKGLKVTRYLIIDFRITGAKNIVLPIKNHVI